MQEGEKLSCHSQFYWRYIVYCKQGALVTSEPESESNWKESLIYGKLQVAPRYLPLLPHLIGQSVLVCVLVCSLILMSCPVLSCSLIYTIMDISSWEFLLDIPLLDLNLLSCCYHTDHKRNIEFSIWSLGLIWDGDCFDLHAVRGSVPSDCVEGVI